MRRCQGFRDHAGRQFEAATDRRIIPFGNEIHLTVLERPFRPDLWIFLHEGRQERQDIVPAEMRAHADFQYAGRFGTFR